ncbi:uncharacterized protein MONBRDRAFT_10297 [Monosiga brevicollis MX1]|uniref:Tetratricopeptide repeat protein n=1 Tax=Monosiga brevicollis TaxID=81824 RepID=A9V5T3_MONBE|nr:uncharacterized protein MONBRDRAFT_10297 [Monosiga brevicollis MX1]EDQ87171.1 predicted protein [Monosiga brevicollis MX1]|eukprot:XP_001748114.1 hypothetical protein [Monosiga brevicollis MX1]
MVVWSFPYPSRHGQEQTDLAFLLMMKESENLRHQAYTDLTLAEADMILQKHNRLSRELMRLRSNSIEIKFSADDYVSAAILYRFKGNTTLAIECYRHALAINAKHEQALLQLGYCMLRAAHFALGETLQVQKRLLEAITEYETAIALTPQHGSAQLRLKAARALLRELDSQKNASSTWALIGFCVAFTLLAVYFGVAMPEQNEARVKELYRPFPQASTRSAPGTRPMTTGAQLRQRPGPPHRK